jgi:hypothetical protein
MYVFFRSLRPICDICWQIMKWGCIISAYTLAGTLLALVFIGLGLAGVLLATVLGLSRWSRARSASELRRGLREGWLLGIAPSTVFRTACKRS